MKKLIILFFAINLLAISQDINKTYFSLSPKGFINSWLIRGAFTNTGKSFREQDFLKAEGGETNNYTFEMIEKSLGQGSKFTDQKKWYPLYSENYIINLLQYYTITSKTVAYALCYIESEKDQTVKIKFGSDDGVKLFVNGKAVHDNPAQRGMAVDNDIAEVSLNKGINSLLLKIDQGEGDWGFCLRITGRDDGQANGLRAVLPVTFENNDLIKTAISSFTINTILTKGYDYKDEKAQEFSKSQFIIHIASEISVPLNFDMALKIKLELLNSSSQVIEEFYKKDVPSLSAFSEEKVIYAPKNCEPGQYVLRLVVLDKDNKELTTIENLVFWN